MADSPTVRSLQLCKKKGWLAAVTEKWIPNRTPYRCRECGMNYAQGGIRRDLFGFIDLVVVDDERGVLAVQTTTASNSAARVRKIQVDCRAESRAWLRAGNRIEVWGWSKRSWKRKDGSTSSVKRWHLTVTEVLL